jgi:hypothetical protein
MSSFTVNYTIEAFNIPTTSNTKHTKLKTAVPHIPDAMAPGKDTE